MQARFATFRGTSRHSSPSNNARPDTTALCSGKIHRVQFAHHRALVVCVTLTLQVHTLFAADEVKVPDVRQQAAAAARQTLTDAGLRAEFQVGKAAPSKRLSFHVTSTQPPAGTLVPRGSAVRVTLYAESTTPDGQVTIPDLRGLSATDAAKQLTALGLSSRFRLGPAAPTADKAYAVIEQQPQAGQQIAAGAQVQLVIHDASTSGNAQTTLLLRRVESSSLSPDHSMRINRLNGDLTVRTTDVAVDAGPFQLTVERTFRTQSGLNGLFAAKWWSNWDMSLIRLGDSILLLEDNRPLPFIALPATSRDFSVDSEDWFVRQLDRLSEGLDSPDPTDESQPDVDDQTKAMKPIAKRFVASLLATVVAELTASDSERLLEALTGPRFVSPDGNVLQLVGTQAQVRRMNGTRDLFDASGRLIERDLRNGHRITLSWADDGTLSQVDGPFGSWLKFEYDERQLPKQLLTSTGVTIRYLFDSSHSDRAQPLTEGAVQYHYDDWSRLVSVTQPRTGPITLTYDRFDRVTSRQWADGSLEQCQYSDADRTVRHTDVNGNTTDVSWSEDGLETESTDPLGGRTLVQSDSLGRPRRITTPIGRVQTFHYDSASRLTEVNDSATGRTRYDLSPIASHTLGIKSTGAGALRINYDQQGNVVSVRGANGEVEAAYEYLKNGLIHRAVGDDGVPRKYRYDARGRVIASLDALGHQTQYEYDQRGNLLRRVDPRGQITRWTYDDRNRVTSETDPEGGTTRYEYNDRGLLVRLIEPSGNVTRYEYNQRGNVVRELDSEGRVTSWTYRADGLVSARTDPDGQTTRWEYDANGHLTRTIDALGRAWTQDVDAAGRPVRLIDPSGLVTTQEWTEDGRLLRQTDPDGTTVEYLYDEQLRLIEIRDNHGRFSRFDYTEDGRITHVASSDGDSLTLRYDNDRRLSELIADGRTLESYTYDELGRTRTFTTDTGLTTTYEYDPSGNIASVSTGDDLTFRMTHDGNRRPTTLTDAQGQTHRLQYDLAGRLTSHIDPDGNTTRRQYNPSGDLTRVIDRNGDQTRLQYDAGHRLTTVTRSSRHTTRYEYNPIGQVTRSTNTLGHETLSTYDSAGRLHETTDANGNTTRFEYDELGQLSRKLLADGTVISYQYDSAGRVSEINDGHFPVRYTYDARGQQTGIEYPAIRRKLSWQYDDQSRRIGLTTSEGRQFAYEYDEHDRLKVIAVDGQHHVALGSDAAHRRTSVAWPNGVTATYRYVPGGRLQSLQYSSSADEKLCGWTHQYDAVGRLTQIDDVDGQSSRFRFDPAGQIVEERLPGDLSLRYSYGPGGNRTRLQSGDDTVVCRYDEADRLVQVGDVRLSYDANGNLVRREGDGGTTQYAYNVRNQLIKVVLPDGSEVRYGYAPTGERIWREDAVGRTWFLNDGVDTLVELDGDLNPIREYVHVPTIDRPLMMFQRGEAYCLHADAIGSIRSVTDSDGHQVLSRDYDGFGNVVLQDGSIECPPSYTARDADPATGLIYLRARWYDPRLGRFISADPISGDVTRPLTMNPYIYALNNPVQNTDPWGEATEEFDRAVEQMIDLQLRNERLTTVIRGGALSRNPEVNNPARLDRFRNEMRANQRTMHRLSEAHPGSTEAFGTRYSERYDSQGYQTQEYKDRLARAETEARQARQARGRAQTVGVDRPNMAGRGGSTPPAGSPPKSPTVAVNARPAGDTPVALNSRGTGSVSAGDVKSGPPKASATGRISAGLDNAADLGSPRPGQSALPPVRPPQAPDPGVVPNRGGRASFNPEANPTGMRRVTGAVARGIGHASNALSAYNLANDVQRTIEVGEQDPRRGLEEVGATFGGFVAGLGFVAFVGNPATIPMALGVAALNYAVTNMAQHAGRAAGRTLGNYLVPLRPRNDGQGQTETGSGPPIPPGSVRPPDTEITQPPVRTGEPLGTELTQGTRTTDPGSPDGSTRPTENLGDRGDGEPGGDGRTTSDDDIDNFVTNLIMDIITSDIEPLDDESRPTGQVTARPINQAPVQTAVPQSTRPTSSSSTDDLNRYRRVAQGLDSQLRQREAQIAELERQRRELARQQAAQQAAAAVARQQQINAEIASQQRHRAAIQAQRRAAWNRYLNRALQQQLQNQRGHGHGQQRRQHRSGGEIGFPQ